MNNSIFKNKNYLLLIISKLISTIGTFVQSTAFALYTIDKTQSSMLFASVLMATLIPKVILSPFCGVIVDWLDRKKLLYILDFLSGILLLATVWIIGSNEINLELIFAVSIGLGVISAIYEPTTIAIVPEIMEKDKIDTANSINMIVAAVGNLVGPLLGVALYGFFGIKIVLIINGVSFIIGAILEVFMIIPKSNVAEEKHTLSKFKSDFVGGIKFILNHKRIKLITACILIQNCFFNGATQVGIPFISRANLKVSNTEFALIDVVVILGVVVGASLSAIIKKNLTTDELFVRMLKIISVSFMGIALITLGFIPSLQINFYLILAMYMVLGITSINVTIAFQSELQKEVDNNFLGRISSMVLSLIMLSIPIGQAIYGWMLNILPSYIPFVSTAVIIFAVALYYNKARKGLGQYIKGGDLNEIAS